MTNSDQDLRNASAHACLTIIKSACASEPYVCAATVCKLSGSAPALALISLYLCVEFMCLLRCASSIAGFVFVLFLVSHVENILDYTWSGGNMSEG